MDNEFEHIIKKVKNIKLSENERLEMRANLLANLIPRETEIEVEEYKDIRGFKNTRLYYFMTYGYRYKFAPAFMMILVVVLAGGTSAFAEKAVPGDFLYTVKIFVNEPALEILALAKGEKTQWQEQLVERRLGEAQKLIATNDFNKTKRIYLEDKIKNQIDQFSGSANELALRTNESTNSFDLNMKLQASLKAHQNVLATLSEENNSSISSDTKQETGALLAVLAESQDKVKNDQKNFESNKKPDSVFALAKQTEALDLLDSTKVLYEKEKVNLADDIQSQINDKFTEVDALLEEGKTFVDTADYANAIDKFQLAIDGVNETKLSILSNTIKGNIEENIDSNPQP